MRRMLKAKILLKNNYLQNIGNGIEHPQSFILDKFSLKLYFNIYEKYIDPSWV
jgi:hypothetical protein